MEDAASEISDWEVLSAASGCGGGDDDNEVLIVSGGGGDLLHDHFALATDPDPDPAAAGPVAEFPVRGPWSDPGAASQGSESLDGFAPILRASLDFAAGVSSDQPPIDGGDEAAREEGSILETTVAPYATWGANGGDAIDAEIGQGGNAVISLGVGGLRQLPPPALHAVGGETMDSDAADASLLQREASESPLVQSDDRAIDAGVESSCLDDAVSGDGSHGEQEEEEQGDNAHAAPDCDAPGGEAKGAASRGPEEGEKQVAVWWRLPFRLLHFCAWKVKPVWSFSIAAALLGLVVLGRRMYRMRRNAKGLPQIKIAFDDKRASQFADRAGRLNEAFLVARRVPLLRASSGAVLPWSMVHER